MLAADLGLSLFFGALAFGLVLGVALTVLRLR
jgi:hypothetical protein